MLNFFKRQGTKESITVGKFLDSLKFSTEEQYKELQRNAPTNLKSVVLLKTSESLTLIQNKVITSSELPLRISREKADIRVKFDEAAFKDEDLLAERSFTALLGICDYNGEFNLIFVENARLRFNFNGHNIFEIEDVVAIKVSNGEESPKFTKILKKVF